MTLHFKINFADVRFGDYPGLSKWAQCNHKNPYKREVGGSKSQRQRRRCDDGIRSQCERLKEGRERDLKTLFYWL